LAINVIELKNKITNKKKIITFRLYRGWSVIVVRVIVFERTNKNQ